MNTQALLKWFLEYITTNPGAIDMAIDAVFEALKPIAKKAILAYIKKNNPTLHADAKKAVAKRSRRKLIAGVSK